MPIDPSILDFVARAGLADTGCPIDFESLAGGVSSDIWLVRAGDRKFCVKRALPRLRVAAEWRAEVSRNATEVTWLTEVAGMNRDLVPAVLASDPALGVFAMEYLPPEKYELWKTRLSRGVVEIETAASVGRCLVTVHSEFARSSSAPDDFDSGAAFHQLP